MTAAKTWGALVLCSMGVSAQGQPHLPPLDRVLPARAEAVYQVLASLVDAGVAMETVRLRAPLWRLAGNPAFELSQQFIRDRLTAGGFVEMAGPRMLQKEKAPPRPFDPLRVDPSDVET